MKNKTLPLLLCLLPGGFLPLLAEEEDIPPLVINEVQVANTDLYLDYANCYGAWVEIYNPADTVQPLRGMLLSDGQNEYKLLAAHGTVPAGGFKVIWFDHNYSEGQYGSRSRLQVPYKLDPDGGTISLLTTDGTVCSSVEYPPSIPRCSWIRTTDGGEEWAWTGEPTPAASNNGCTTADFRLEAPDIIPMPGYSKSDCDSHVFSEPFKIRVRTQPGSTLRYTTDGSTPTATNGLTSQNGRFDIDTTTVLRLCYMKDGSLPSPVVTRSYICRNHDYYLPILSVVSDPKHFFDNRVGVFVRGTNGVSGNGQSAACNWNMDWERPVNMEYLVPEQDADGNTGYRMAVNQEADLEICGGWTRAYGAATVDGRYWEARSSFRLKTDKRYEGVHAISYPVFPSKPHNKYRCWQVRNGGNDTYARTTDPAVQQMVLRSGFYVDCQDYQPAHVFLNGQYYGMLNIRESNNKHFAYSNYGIEFDDMDQFDLSNAQYNQKLGDSEAWNQLQSLATKLAQNKSEETYREICDLLDIDEYANYMALECYIGPSDWITNTNNVKGFRSRSDGKFHFVLFDLDSAFGTSTMLTDVLNTSGGANVDDLFRRLMKYEPFRRQFMDAYCIVDGSVFEPTRCEEIVREIYANTRQALAFEGSSPSQSLIRTIQGAWGGTRIQTLRNYYGPDYELYASISSDTPEARLSLNGQEIPTGKFCGYLFSCSGQPVTLAAKAPAGYTFGGWLRESEQATQTALIPEGSEWMYYDKGSMDNYAWKDLSFDEAGSGWRRGKAPFGFATEGYYMQDYSATKLDQGTGTKRPTYYFRAKFRLEAPLAGDDALTFNYQVDDGMILYVNGHEAGSYYVASDATYADYTIGQHFEGQNPYAGHIDIPHEFLRVGENQIAVAVKNCHGNSSDAWFEGSLSLTAKERDMVTESDTFDATQEFLTGSRVTLKAIFNPITGERERQEAGATPIRINEVSAVGDIQINEYGKKADWLELYNTTDQDFPLEGLYLSDNASKPQKYQLTGGTVPAHGTRIVWCDKKEGLTELHAPFKLENADGASVSIQAADGAWADRLDYMEHNKFQTFGRYPDGGNMATILNQPTIEASNKLGMTDFTALDDEDWMGRERTITLELAEGWNWTSHNMAGSVDKSRFLLDALQLQGQTESLLFLADDGWQGSLQALDAATGYKIRMRQARDVTLRGPIFDTATPVRLNAGWNWAGCPLYNATTLEAALANYAPSEGDKLVGLDAFATFEGGKWHGTLTSLSPGQAYLFYTDRPKEFCWQSLSPMKARSKRYASAKKGQGAMDVEQEMVNGEWSIFNVNIHSHPDVMTMVAKVEADNSISPEEPYAVGAFCGEECRGVGIVEDGLLYMNIHGEEHASQDGSERDDITFRLIDSLGDTYNSPGCIRFQDLRQLGTVQNPYPLWFASRDVVDEIKPAVASSARIRAVHYYNLSGQRIAEPQSSRGVCIRKEIGEDGAVKVSKVYEIGK